MPYTTVRTEDVEPLRRIFGERLQENVPLARYTAARVGGPAEYFLEVRSAEELADAAGTLWSWNLPFFILGGGSNVLISDRGVAGVVLLNRARRVQFNEQTDMPTVWAESGANLGLVARLAAQRGLAGLEWAAGIPGTVGGAVFGNAGAHGGDMSGSLVLAEILHQDRCVASPYQGQPMAAFAELWPVEKLGYSYRSSMLKHNIYAESSPSGLHSAGHVPQSVILAACLRLERSLPEDVKAHIEQLVEYRRRTQPPGASMGSMFKNPPGDYAGRLIEAAGLKGARFGDVEISTLHANFFINKGQASAADVCGLIQLARQRVLDEFGVELELEIELVGGPFDEEDGSQNGE